MKVLSMLQPWATLVVIGAKKIETRSWDTKHRGSILIHASKKMTKAQKELCKKEPFKSALEKFEELQLGKIIGKVDILSTSTTEFFKQCSNGIPLSKDKPFSKEEWKTELAFGDYNPGRFGWILENPLMFSHNIYVSGSLGLWDFDDRICLGCGCTEMDCRHCIEKTGKPCYWVNGNLCSACAK